MKHKFMQTYIYKGEQVFFISTALRDGSTELEENSYYETMVWALNKEMQKDKVISMEASLSRESAFKQHFIECELVNKTNL